MKLTDEDIAIMNRFDWIPYDSEHKQPSYLSKLADRVIFWNTSRKIKWPRAFISVRNYYAESMNN